MQVEIIITDDKTCTVAVSQFKNTTRTFELKGLSAEQAVILKSLVVGVSECSIHDRDCEISSLMASSRGDKAFGYFG